MAARVLAALAVAVAVLALGTWVLGDYWAAHQCVEGGRGADLLGAREGSVVVRGRQCVARSSTGVVHAADLASWGARPAAAWWALMALALAGGALAARRSARRPPRPGL